MNYSFYGKKIELKEFGCNQTDIIGNKISPFVNIFVKVTNKCNAYCLFCSNSKSTNIESFFNLPKLLEIIIHLETIGISINKLNITGGEPSVVYNLVDEILQAFSKEEFKHIHLHLNS